MEAERPPGTPFRALRPGEYKATSSPLAVEGFSRESELKKVRKVLGDDIMNFATSSTE